MFELLTTRKKDTMKEIIQGVHRFRTQIFPEKRGMYKALADGQRPSALASCVSASRKVAAAWFR